MNYCKALHLKKQQCHQAQVLVSSQLTSCVGFGRTSHRIPQVFYMGIVYQCKQADGMLKSTQSIILYGTVFCFSALYSIVFYWIVVHYNVSYCIVWYHIVKYCIVRYCIALYHTVPYHIIAYHIISYHIVEMYCHICVCDFHIICHLLCLISGGRTTAARPCFCIAL